MDSPIAAFLTLLYSYLTFSIVEQSVSSPSSLSLRKRVWLVFLACCVQMIYIPTSNRVEGGIEPKLPIDIFPISAIWVLPYVSCYLLWISSFIWILYKVEDRAFRSFIAACILTFGLGALTFILFPTYVPAAVLTGNDIFTNILRMIHESWGRYAALPSGHVYITTLLVLFFSRWYPRSRPVWMVILIVVSLSTLFTAQHYILDVIGGVLVALMGYHFGLWWTGVYSAQKQISKQSRKRIPSSSLN
jgi:membrane-associated phospholipid phosphatase